MNLLEQVTNACSFAKEVCQSCKDLQSRISFYSYQNRYETRMTPTVEINFNREAEGCFRNASKLHRELLKTSKKFEERIPCATKILQESKVDLFSNYHLPTFTTYKEAHIFTNKLLSASHICKKVVEKAYEECIS